MAQSPQSASTRAIACLIAGAIMSAGCGHSDNTRAAGNQARNHPNLLLITLDTTRADRLGAYGHEQARTPALDALAARGVTFEEAYTPSPMTLPAHTTLLTGLLPPQHGVRLNGEHRLAENIPTLTETLGAAGYRTGAFVAAFVLNHRFGLARGFDHYDDDLSGAYEQEVPSLLASYRPGNLVVDAALDWLSEASRPGPFFAWVHLYDAHYPWHAHEPHAASDDASYDGELEFVDRQVARLLAFLDERGLLDRTLVVALADHGEGLGDHVEIEHAYLLNEEVLHVPWIVAGPGVATDHRVTAIVSLEDFAPTVGELLGLRMPDGIHGRSLAPALGGSPIESGLGYAETDLPWSAFRWSPQRSLTTERWKFIRTPLTELYDRASDRAEHANLFEVKPGVHERLDARLRALEQELGERESVAAALSSDEIDQLAALGYSLGGASEDGASGGSALADVKQRLAAKDLESRLRRGLALGVFEPPEILELARQLVHMSPETPSFHGRLGAALVDVGEIQNGIAELELAVNLDPRNASAHYALGDVFQREARFAEARSHFEAALEIDPDLAAAHVGLGNVLRAEGRADLAAGRYAEALRLRPLYPEAHFNLALTFVDRALPEKAREHFEEAIHLRPDWGRPHAALAHLCANQGLPEEAIDHYEKAIARLPEDAGLHNELGVVLDEVDRESEARAHFLEAARIAPEFYRPHVNLANLAFAAGDDAEALKEYEYALRLAPGLAEPTARLARFLATCPDESFRDAERAVALAERAADLTGAVNPHVLDTLAAAYASAGNYAKALSRAHRAQQRAMLDGRETLASAIESRVALYALEEPYVELRPAIESSSEDH